MNVIVMMLDTFRWDYLSGICSNPKLRTPEIERFAQKCTVFDETYSHTIPTLPNRADLFTGLSLLASGGGWKPLRKDIPTLAGMMTEAGFLTQIVYSTPHISLNGNFYERGFQFHHRVRDAEADTRLSPGFDTMPKLEKPEEDARYRHTFDYPGLPLCALTEWMLSGKQCEEDHVAPQVAFTVSKFLQANYKNDHPFFLWVDKLDPHEPFLCPEHFRSQFDPNYKGKRWVHQNYGRADAFNAEEFEDLCANYKGQAVFADKWFGYMVRKIEELGLMENTMIIFTSDHGIYMGEHNRTGKDNHNNFDDRHWPVYPEVMRIPLAIYHPEVEKPGRHVKGFVQPIDITSTILDAAGAPHPHLHGISLMPQVRGEQSRATRAFAITGRTVENPSLIMDNLLYQPLGEGREPALFDLEHDPLCEKNIHKENPEQAEKMEHTIINFYREFGGGNEEIVKCYQKRRPFSKDPFLHPEKK